MSIDTQNILESVQAGKAVRPNMIAMVPEQSGVYALYYLDQSRNTNILLKVGKSLNLRRRLKLHFQSNPANTVLARHMQSDTACSTWRRLALDFTQRDDRKKFLANYCYFKVVALPQYTKSELQSVEHQLEDLLHPRYKGSVGEPYGELE